MKNCKYCGTEIADEAVFCPNCGANQSLAGEGAGANAAPEVHASAYSATAEKYTGWTVLGFFIPLVALICYFVWKDSEPLKARAVGKGGLMYVSLNPIVGLIVYIVMKDNYPDISKACGICGIIGVVLNVFTFFLSFMFSFLLLMMA